MTDTLVSAAVTLVVWWIATAALRAYGQRHRHRWVVVALNGGSYSELQFAYRGMLDRCKCGRLRWRPNVPVPAWWPSKMLLSDRTDLPDVGEVQWWLETMPRWRQRRERRQVEAQLAWAKGRAAEDEKKRQEAAA